MRSTLEQRRSAWKRRVLLGVPLVIVAISFLTGSPAVPVEPAEEVSQVVGAASPNTYALTQAGVPPCSPREAAIAPADVGVGDAVRCLPVGGDEVRSSRVDPLYGRVAAELIDRIAGRAEGFAEPVRVICWSEKDWRRLVVSFQDAGKIDALKYWLGWATKGRSVVNLSYLACLQLDRIAYRDGRLALPATGSAVGTLAHETMHVAGIFDEGIADCYAMQLTAVTALGLGAEPEYADRLRTMNVEFNEANRSGTEYDSPECYDGGPLDLDPESPRWP